MHDPFPISAADYSPDLLVRPSCFRGEGPKGYLLRLAEANCMSIGDLSQMGIRYDPECFARQRLLPEFALYPEVHDHVARMSGWLKNKPRIWNHHQARFCPECLAAYPLWLASWEIYFYDVCHFHGVWLVDRCTSCGDPIHWNRPSLLRCQCGSDLTQEKTELAHHHLWRLSMWLNAKLLEQEEDYLRAPVAAMDIEQLQRLVRYLGTYLDPQPSPRPYRLRQLRSIKVSWHVSSLAAEILNQWPWGMHYMLSQQQSIMAGTKAGLNSVFRQAYLYLYKGLSEPAFAPIRDAFEAWLAEHWKGGLALRNRRLTLDLLQSAQWIPGSLAAKELGVSMARLNSLVAEGKLEGQISVSTTGRRFTMVRRDRLESLHVELIDEITMAEAMEYLGIGKIRMKRLIRLLFPTARQVDNQVHLPWCVPRSEVEALLNLGSHLPVVGIAEEHQVSLAHVLRYWNWTSDEIVALIESVRSGGLLPRSHLEGAQGITRWVFDITQLRAFHQANSDGTVKWLSVVEAAKILDVKQAVAYWLVHQGIVGAESIGGPRGASLKISRDELDRFCQQYVFGREIAALLGRSPRKTKEILAEQGLHPLRIDGAAPCRQLVYSRTSEMQQFLGQLKGTTASDFALVSRLGANAARNIALDGKEAVSDPIHALQPPESAK